jgi:hypothetical protein
VSDRGKIDPLFVKDLDKILDEYAEKCRLDDEVLHSLNNQDKPESVDFNCKFKDTCYVFKFKMGSCPCELNE